MIAARLRSAGVVIFGLQKFLRTMKCLDPGPPVVLGVPPACGGMWGREPLGVTVGVLAWFPALFVESVVGSEGQGQFVDIGAVGGRLATRLTGTPVRTV